MNLTRFKPMLASPVEDERLTFPLLASPKLDGVRAIVLNGIVLSRSLKPIPNRQVQALFSHLEYWDGELIVGPQNSPTVYRDTVSGVMSEDGEPNVTFCAFDYIADPALPFRLRHTLLRTSHQEKGSVSTALLPQHSVAHADELFKLEAQHLEQGYEGLILRGLDAPYKFGRSTAREGYLLKLKRFMDGEAQVLEVIEELHNGNEATTNELGRTKRSSHKANKTGKGRMGALRVRDLVTKVEFQIGTGFTDEDRAWWWEHGGPLYPIIKYKFFPVGVKVAPRHPVYLGLRDKRDM